MKRNSIISYLFLCLLNIRDLEGRIHPRCCSFFVLENISYIRVAVDELSGRGLALDTTTIRLVGWAFA